MSKIDDNPFEGDLGERDGGVFDLSAQQGFSLPSFSVLKLHGKRCNSFKLKAYLDKGWSLVVWTHQLPPIKK